MWTNTTKPTISYWSTFEIHLNKHVTKVFVGKFLANVSSDSHEQFIILELRFSALINMRNCWKLRDGFDGMGHMSGEACWQSVLAAFMYKPSQQVQCVLYMWPALAKQGTSHQRRLTDFRFSTTQQCRLLWSVLIN